MSSKQLEKHISLNGERIAIDSLIDLGKLMDAVDNTDSSPDLWSEETQQASNAIISLCTDLTVSDRKFSPENWVPKFQGYIQKYGRLSYANISNFVFDLCENSNAFDTLDINLHKVMNYWLQDMQKRECPYVEDDLWKTLLKFNDHISLARFQYTMYLNRKVDINNMVDARIGPKISDASRELTSQLVGLVGIFTALSFIVFGGISSLENLFNSLGKNADNVFPVLIIAIAWALCFSNLLLGFMYFILRVIGRLPERRADGTLVQRYPAVFWTNYSLVSSLLVCLAIWGADKTGIGKPIYERVTASENSVAAFWICLAALLFMIAVPGGIILWRFCKKKK